MLQVSFGQLPSDLLLGNPWPSASLGELWRHLVGRDAVLHLGVCDGPVLLPQVQPQLAFVAEVQVALLTLQSKKQRHEASKSHPGTHPSIPWKRTSSTPKQIPILPLCTAPIAQMEWRKWRYSGRSSGEAAEPPNLDPARHGTPPHSSSLHPHAQQEAVI